MRVDPASGTHSHSRAPRLDAQRIKLSTAGLLERRRALRADTVRRKQREAKNRCFKTPEPVSPHAPAEGTIGWVRRQGAALGVMLHELHVSPNGILVAGAMLDCSNELGETDVGQRRIAEMTGLSLSSIYRAWVELRAVGFFLPVTMKDHYRKKRRAGTHHVLNVPRDEKLSSEYVFPPLKPDPRDTEPRRLAREAQRALEFVEPEPTEPPAPARAASPPHVGGPECPCRPCRASADALNQENRPSVRETGEASLTVTISGTEDGSVIDEVTSPRAMLPRPDAPIGASDAAPDPSDRPPTRGGSSEPRLTTEERAAARAIDRDIARRGWSANAPRKRPSDLETIANLKPPPSAISMSVRTVYASDGTRTKRIDVEGLSKRLSAYLPALEAEERTEQNGLKPQLERRAGAVPDRAPNGQKNSLANVLREIGAAHPNDCECGCRE